MQTVHICVEVDNPSPKISERMTGYLLDCPGRKNMKPRWRFYRTEESHHAAIIESLAEALDRMNIACEIHIHSKNTFVLSMMQSNLPTWAEHGFCTSKGEPVKNRSKWMRLWETLNRYRHQVIIEPGEHSYYQWMQGEMMKLRNADSSSIS